MYIVKTTIAFAFFPAPWGIGRGTQKQSDDDNNCLQALIRMRTTTMIARLWLKNTGWIQWWGWWRNKCGLNITIMWRIMIYLQWSQWTFAHCKYQNQHLHVPNSTGVVEDEEADLIIFPSCLVPQGRGVTSTHFRLLMMINKMLMAIISSTNIY